MSGNEGVRSRLWDAMFEGPGGVTDVQAVVEQIIAERLAEERRKAGDWRATEAVLRGQIRNDQHALSTFDDVVAERDALAARVEAVERLAEMARRAVVQTETTCTCADEPHQNLLHDLAHDLDAAITPTVCDAAMSGTEGRPDLPPLIGGRANVITLCGSTRFKTEFIAANQRLTMGGNVVISLGVFGHTDLPDYDWTTDASDLKRALDRLHFQKIDMADEVYVINPGGYVGESTLREIDYAEGNGKPVRYLVPLRAPDALASPDPREHGTGGGDE